MRAVKHAGLDVENLCANRGLCITCAAVVIDGADSGLSSASKEERRMLDWIGAPATVRLSCQAIVTGDVTVRVGISPIAREEYDPGSFIWD
jgi:ferredoxin